MDQNNQKYFIMNPHLVELSVLTACQKMIQIKQKLIKPLAKQFEIPPQAIFYNWLLGKIPQHGYFSDHSWKYFFHGFECDLRHCHEGLMIRIEFGPQGRIDTFTDWGLFQFITTFHPHWFSAPTVVRYFAKIPENLENYQKISFIINQFKYLQLVIPVAPELIKDSLFDSSALTEDQYFDSRVGHRLIISPPGWEVLSQQLPTTSKSLAFI